MSSVQSSSNFNASVFISEQLSRQLINIAQDLAERCVQECGSKYNFDASEAINFLGLSKIKMERKAAIKVNIEKTSKVVIPKSSFPLPYNGEFVDSCCYALRQNNGLYTQCTGHRKGEAQFCKGCANQMQKIGGEVPEYGTIQQRMAVGISEYVDPKGRKPTAYFKIMKKYKLTEEQVQEEASKVNVVISPEHFVVPDDTKRGRPKVEKEEKEKGAKGRPKKTKKVLQIEGDDDDLFAALVAEANESEDESVLPKKKAQKSDEDKESDRLAKEVEKAHKEVKRLAEKEARDAKLAQEKSDRDEKKKAEEDTRAAKKKAEEDTRAAKKKAEEDAKEAKKLALEQAKSDKDSKKKKVVVAEPESTQEADVVKKIEYEGKKYLKSKNTGVIYDYIAYTKQEEQIVVGQWSDSQNKIIFNTSGEESEEEYDE
jgi:hypothetical protein